jgi:Ca-activated chloride channel family protein
VANINLTAPSSLPVAVIATSETLEVVANLDRSTVLQGDGTLRVEVTVRAFQEQAQAQAATAPTDLIVVMDRSGSMGGQKLMDAKTAAMELLAQLGPEDRFSLVSYESSAWLDIALTPATEQAKAGWRRHIQALEATGGTNMHQGLETGRLALDSTPGRAQRMILISDGLPDSQAGLLDQATRLGQREVPLTTVGIGLNYDEQLMASMADAGTGNFYWVQGSDDMASTFAAELDAAREMVASGLTVGFQPGGAPAVLLEAAGYTLTPAGDGGARFSAGSLFSQQERTFWLTMAVDTAETGPQDLGELQLQWRDLMGEAQRATVSLPSVQVTADPSQYVASFDSERWGRGVVDESYNRMRVAVSAQVQDGDKDGALALIDTYNDSIKGLNDSLGNDDVRLNLDEVATLRQEVEDNFTGADQGSRQNFWSKSVNISAYQSRRGGQYR